MLSSVARVRRVLTLWSLLTAVTFVQPVAAQTPRSSAPAPALSLEDPPAPVAPETVSRGENGRVVVRAIRLTQPLRIDGKLDEAVYQQNTPATDFIQSTPSTGKVATEKTEAWVLFDKNFIYIVGRIYESVPPGK